MKAAWYWTPRVMEAIDAAIGRGVFQADIAEAIGVDRISLYQRRRYKRRWSVADETMAIASIEALCPRPKKPSGWFGESARHGECQMPGRSSNHE